MQAIEREDLGESSWKRLPHVDAFHDVRLLEKHARIVAFVMAPGVIDHALRDVYARERLTPMPYECVRAPNIHRYRRDEM